MSHISNSILSMEKMINIIEESSRINMKSFENLMQMIETARSSGNLEPENYEQLMSGFVKNGIEPKFMDANNNEAPKMLNYLNALKQKLQEYLNING